MIGRLVVVVCIDGPELTDDGGEMERVEVAGVLDGVSSGVDEEEEAIVRLFKVRDEDVVYKRGGVKAE